MRQHDMGGNPRPLTYNEVATYLQFYPHPDPAFVAELTIAIDRRFLPVVAKEKPPKDKPDGVPHPPNC